MIGNGRRHSAGGPSPRKHTVGNLTGRQADQVLQVPVGVEAADTPAKVRRAQAGYDQARLEAETKLRGALAARPEAEASLRAARTSLGESQKVLTLTESLYHAGRTDLDNVQHAQMDRERSHPTNVRSRYMF